MNFLYHSVTVSVTFNGECLDKTPFALLLHCDPTFVGSRVGRPGRVDFIHGCGVAGGQRVDGNIVPYKLETMCEVKGGVMTDADLTA